MGPTDRLSAFISGAPPSPPGNAATEVPPTVALEYELNNQKLEPEKAWPWSGLGLLLCYFLLCCSLSFSLSTAGESFEKASRFLK